VIFESTNPLTSRLRYKSRGFWNTVCVALLFLAFLIVFSWLASILFPGSLAMVFVDVIGLACAYWLFNFLGSRPIGFDCNHCGKYVTSNTPWVCGFCKQTNQNANEFPFVHKCEHCGNEPKAYKCHHADCGGLIFLTRDMLKINYAYCLNSPTEIPKPDERAEKLKTDQERLQDKQNERDMAKLDEELKGIKERVEGPKIKTPYEQKKESFDKYYDGVVGMREYARKKRVEAAEAYKNDPAALKDANDAIDEFLRRSA
jgi:hypothetical protein